MSPSNSSKSSLPKYLQEKRRFIAQPYPIELDAHILALVILWARAALFGRSGDEGVQNSRIAPYNFGNRKPRVTQGTWGRFS
jgi:hypothetical protein